MQSQIKNFHKQNNLVAKLMREKYPVLISNTVDPFASSNYQLTVPIVDQLTDLGIPVTFQTRGAATRKADEAIDHVLANTSPSVYYISITTTSENLRKTLEPGATTIESRFKLIERIQKAGHKVVVGINPYVKEWIPDLDAMVSRLYDMGIRNIWLGILHFNAKQKESMTDKEAAAIGAELLNKNRPAIAKEHEELRATVKELQEKYSGLNVFLGINGRENYYFDIYHETYDKTFPVFNDLYNWVSREKPKKITFNDFMNVFGPKLPEGKYDFSGSAYSIKRADYDKPEVRQLINSLKSCHISEYLKLLWNDRVFGFKPSLKDAFATIVKQDGDDVVLDLDGGDNEQYAYDPINSHEGEEFVFYNQ